MMLDTEDKGENGDDKFYFDDFNESGGERCSDNCYPEFITAQKMLKRGSSENYDQVSLLYVYLDQ